MCPFGLCVLQLCPLSHDSSFLVAEAALVVPPHLLIDPHELAQRRVFAVLLQCALLQSAAYPRPLVALNREVFVLYLALQPLQPLIEQLILLS